MKNIFFLVIAAMAIFATPNSLWAQKTESVSHDGRSNEKIKAEIAKRVLDAYQTKEIYKLMTPGFEAVEQAAVRVEEEFGDLCIDSDYFYCTQDMDPNRFEVKNVNLISKTMAAVHLTLIFDSEGYHNTESIVLIMVQIVETNNPGTPKWLVDDVWYNMETGSYSSVKQGMIECVIYNQSFSQ